MTKNGVITAESLILELLPAVSKGDFPQCEKLINQGVYADCRDEYGNSALMMAVGNGKKPKLARMLLKAGAAVNGTNVLGETALLNASAARNASAVALLLHFGANPNVASRTGYTALMAAAMGHEKVVHALIRAEAEPSVSTPKGWTALMFAEDWGQEEVAEFLKVARTTMK